MPLARFPSMAHGRSHGAPGLASHLAWWLRAVLLLAFVIGRSASAQGSGPLPADYELGPGDVVRIQVFQTPDMTTEARVSDSGHISFPLLGNIVVGGLTPAAAEQLIAQRLRDGSFVARPQVSLNILQFRSQQVSVLGNVGRPGRYPVEQRGMRLTEMLANAGGILPAGADTLVLLRRANGKIVRHDIDLPSLYLENRNELDLPVQGGDSIYVHRAPVYYVFGQVQRPGQFTLERQMTVSQAVAKGGGFTLRARENAVVIKRRDPDGRTIELTGRMEDPVQPDDQIYVRESLF